MNCLRLIFGALALANFVMNQGILIIIWLYFVSIINTCELLEVHIIPANQIETDSLTGTQVLNIFWSKSKYIITYL
jgi:hypothetical protein